MKKFALSLIAAASFAGSANAIVIDFYAGATGSLGKDVIINPDQVGKDITQNASSFGAVAGIDIPIVRVEGEYNYLVSKGAGLHAGMINAYMKLTATPIVKPYIGLGIGSVLGGKINNGDAKSAAAFQGMFGLQFDIPATPLFVDLEGRLFYADKIYHIDVVDKDIGFAEYDVRAKIRYVF